MKISAGLADFLSKHTVFLPISERELARSVAPQVMRLSDFYNGIAPDSPWVGSSKLPQLRQAYLRHYLPLGLLRMGAVWEELGRLGFRGLSGQWPETIRALDVGAGPGSSAFGFLAARGEVPKTPAIHWTWVDRDLPLMEAGSDAYLAQSRALGISDQVRCQKTDLRELFSTHRPNTYHLWVANVSLRELGLPHSELAELLLGHWQKSVEPGGLMIILEAGSRDASRWLLELRQELLTQQKDRKSPLTLLTPCLGTQACGALADPKDWCHETLEWRRPEEFRKLDELTGMNHRMIDFSYLVFTKSAAPRGEILTKLAQGKPERLVSPAHKMGRDYEYWICGATGKRKARSRIALAPDLERGSILVDPVDPNAGKSYQRLEPSRVL